MGQPSVGRQRRGAPVYAGPVGWTTSAERSILKAVNVLDRVSVQLPASHGSLADARRELRRALGGAGWTDETVDRVLVAVGEAMTNAVEHGSEAPATVHLDVVVERDQAVVSVRDEGAEGRTCPERVPPVPPASSVRGRGLVMIHALADEVRIRRRGKGTEVRLRFDRLAA